MMKKGENDVISIPGIELAISRSVSKRSPNCATYALVIMGENVAI